MTSANRDIYTNILDEISKLPHGIESSKINILVADAKFFGEAMIEDEIRLALKEREEE